MLTNVNSLEEEKTLGRRIHQTSSKLAAYINQRRKEKNLPTKGYEGNLLFFIFSNPGCLAKDIQREFRISKATVSSSIQNREKKGWLTRKDGKDRRYKVLCVTKEGRKACHPYTEFFRGITKEVENQISRDDKETTLRVLNQILLNLEQAKKGENNENH